LALCANHHLAFDRDLVAVDVSSRRIVASPELRALATTDPAAQALIGATFRTLASPGDRSSAPRPEMFRRRYELSPERYKWLS
jgi:broad specificity phosphatase PhoE